MSPARKLCGAHNAFPTILFDAVCAVIFHVVGFGAKSRAGDRGEKYRASTFGAKSRVMAAPCLVTAYVCGATLVMLGVGCSKGIGDECDSALDCSASASRLCDLSQPHGYCTLAGCRPGSCPDDAVCVTFWQNTDRSELDRNRLSINYCMRKCEGGSDCRQDEGYSCFFGSDADESRVKGRGVFAEASVEEDRNQRFCAASAPTSLKPAPPGDAGADEGTISITAPDGGS